MDLSKLKPPEQMIYIDIVEQCNKAFDFLIHEMNMETLLPDEYIQHSDFLFVCNWYNEARTYLHDLYKNERTITQPKPQKSYNSTAYLNRMHENQDFEVKRSLGYYN